MELFSLSYFWMYLLQSATCFYTQQSSQNFKGSSASVYNYLVLASAICTIGGFAFLIRGFWVMESWWHPIVMLFGAIIVSGLVSPLFEIMGMVGRIILPAISILLTISLFFLV